MAQDIKIINKFGQMIGWNEVAFPLLGRVVEGITEIEYEDDIPKEAEYGGGGFPIGTKRSNYSASGSVTLHLEEKIAIQKSIGQGNRIQDIAPFDIPVTYEYNGEVYTDILRQCEFTNNGVSIKQGDGSTTFKYKLHIPYIDWNA